FGWYIETLRGHEVRRHTGQTAGFAASLAHFPRDRMTVIVLCNLGTIGVAGRIGQAVAKLYVPALSLRALGTKPDEDAQTGARLREIVRAQLAGKPDAEAFTTGARDALSTDSARANWGRFNAYGPLRAFDFAGRETEGERRTLRYRVGLGEHLLLLKFVLNGEGKVSEMSAEEEE
ncbi:MAG TPA: hypothetical protein VEX60_18450, partial [Pyrinomonadaceae bacterium]|nr:hypothetical protein [Pyrinomonadaceae bacterium]